ncbi:hypothetical protein B296_00037352 [Ensete ventricosum]|uniref:Uncharacterized protein n=1 Tax=Ensete ventricosum TaxID=4639 RepID=A0A426X3H6_ENSVE|nr:hypothetical protein B296_00037352 [Ensete ventricosum]
MTMKRNYKSNIDPGSRLGIRQGLDNTVGAHRKIARTSSKVSGRSLGTHREITRGRLLVSATWDDSSSSNDAVRNSPGVRRELAEGIGSLLGWHKGVRRKKTKTYRRLLRVAEKLVGRLGLHPKKIGSGHRCASKRRTREWT